MMRSSSDVQIRKALQSFPTTSEEDQYILDKGVACTCKSRPTHRSDGGFLPRMTAAIRYRLEHKRLLQCMIEILQLYLESLARSP